MFLNYSYCVNTVCCYMKIIKTYNEYTNVPIIIAGGSGDYLHLEKALKHDHINAVACGSIFNFTDNNPFKQDVIYLTRIYQLKKFNLINKKLFFIY